ncbi:MAG: family 20 glycosylhydrolase, partial [Cutibacterium avidum]|nr:family 20 glycosylhydrolase [Cutibacterium avidum]
MPVPSNDTLIRGLCPQPRHVQFTEGRFPLPTVLSWAGPDEVTDAVTTLAERLAPALDVVRVTSHTDTISLIVTVNPALEAEGYRIEIDTQIRITAGDPNGARWAVQTLLQLLPPWVHGPGPLAREHLHLPKGVIVDAPHYSWRGAHLDVSRHFMPASFITRFLDVLAMHKLNRLHLHLTDDQGWRLPVPGWPRLTTVGAWRPGTVRGHQPPPDDNDCDDVAEHDHVPHGGAYTVEQLSAINKRAGLLGITVVPEIDLPGHTESVVAAYPALGCGIPLDHPRTAFGVSEHHINLTDDSLG